MLCGGFTHLVETSHRLQDTAEEKAIEGKEVTGWVGEREGWMKREKRHGDEEREEETERKVGGGGGGSGRREDREERERESQSGS